MRLSHVLQQLRDSAPALDAVGGVLSGEGAAHAHLVAATLTPASGPPRYSALPPRRLEAIYRHAEVVPGFEPDSSPLADVLRSRLDLFSTRISLLGGEVMVLTREAVMAELLCQGGLALGLAGVLLKLANNPPVDVDEVREILKAACQAERFQPLLELASVVS